MFRIQTIPGSLCPAVDETMLNYDDEYAAIRPNHVTLTLKAHLRNSDLTLVLCKVGHVIK